MYKQICSIAQTEKIY